MNRAYIDGKDVIVFMKRIHATVPETVFKAVACLDSNTFSGTKEKKTVQNKCTQGWEDGLPGNGNWQVSASGQAITDGTSTEVSNQVLADVWSKGEIVEIKMANASGTYYRAGTAMITDFSEEANSDDPLSFDITFSGLGVPTLVAPAP